MASLGFLKRTDVSAFRPLVYNGQPVVSQYSKIAEFLSASTVSRLLPEPGLSLFSEQTGYKDVRWYSYYQGDAVAVQHGDDSFRQKAAQQLAEIFSVLGTVISNSSEKDLLRYALLVPSAEDVTIVNNEVVLVNWGFVPRSLPEIETALREHFISLYGQYCEVEKVWPAPLPEAVPGFAAAPAVLPQKSSVNSEAGGNIPPPPFPPEPPSSSSSPRRFSSGFYCFMMLLFILVGLLAGWLTSDYYRPRVWPANVDGEEIQKELNKTLQKERDELRALLDTAICDNPKVLSVLDPGEDDVTVLNPNNCSEKINGMSNVKIGTLLEKSVVMIWSFKGPDLMKTGTGFFIDPHYILTNGHVVENCDKFLIMNRSVDPVDVTLITSVRGASGGSRDYAVLKVEKDVTVTPLPFSEKSAKLARVYAGGYPGFYLENFDQSYNSIISGNGYRGAPDMVLTAGEISSIQNYDPPLIAHTAEISLGNSGGPLINQCGEVVGINTFVYLKKDSLDTVGTKGLFSLGSLDLMKFLDENSIPYSKNLCPCNERGNK